MKKDTEFIRFESLAEGARQMGLPAPKHPLITILDGTVHPFEATVGERPHVLQFYKISYKPQLSGRIRYGQGYYDFDEGGLLFAAPNQVIGKNEHDPHGTVCSRYVLLIHPDFFLNYPLAKKIRQYGFFSYATNEALHLSDEEKQLVFSVFEMIEAELNSRIDDFSQDVVISQIELLLNYANRFYKRQFLTRKAVNNELVQKMEEVLNGYFDSRASLDNGVPTVQWLASELAVSPSYLSDMLRAHTGQNAQQHIHYHLIEKAKEILSTSKLSVSEVAFELGFEHPQSFSKFFKSKTNETPGEFRGRFN